MTPDLRARLIEALHEEQPTTDGLYHHECVDIVDTLIPIIDAHARLEVREFYLDAADEAMHGKRRGPNAVADWLLDFGRRWVDTKRGQAA